MADCGTGNYDNQSDHSAAAKVNNKEDNDKKEKEKEEACVTANTHSSFNKTWSPLSGFSDNSTDHLLTVDDIDPVGSSDSTQALIAECDSAQSSQELHDRNSVYSLGQEFPKHLSGIDKSLTKVADHLNPSHDEHNAYVDNRIFTTSPETSICAVSSTVEDDDDKDCNTVSSSLTGKSVVESKKGLDDDCENSMLSASSSLASELLHEDKDLYIGRNSENQRKRTKSSVAEILLSNSTNCSTYEKKSTQERSVNDKLDLSIPHKKIKACESRVFLSEIGAGRDSDIIGSVSDRSMSYNLDNVLCRKREYINNEFVTRDDNDSQKDNESIDGDEKVNNTEKETLLHISKDQSDSKGFNAIPPKPLYNSLQIDSVFKERLKKKELETDEEKTGKSHIAKSKNSSMQSAVMSLEKSDFIYTPPIPSTNSQRDTIFKGKSSLPDVSNTGESSEFHNDKIGSGRETFCSTIKTTSSSIDFSKEGKLGVNTEVGETDGIGKGSGNSDLKRKYCEPVLSVIEQVVSANLKLDNTVVKCRRVSSDIACNEDNNCRLSPLSLTLPAPTTNTLVSSSSPSSSSSSSPSSLSLSPSKSVTPSIIATSSSPSSPNRTVASSVLSSGKSNTVETELSHKDGLFTCSHCAFSSEQSAFEDHILNHMEDHTFKCEECSSDFKSVTRWRLHLTDCHEGEHLLPSNVSKVIEHVRASNSYKPNFQCPQVSDSKPLIVLNNTQSTTPPSQIPDPDSKTLSPAVTTSDCQQHLQESSENPQVFCSDLEITYVNREYFCLQCMKKSKDKEIFRFHVWTHTHSPESSYCCCTTLTRESCEIVANILQLITGASPSAVALDSGTEDIVICRVRKSDLKLETVSKKQSDVKNLSLAIPLLVDREVEEGSPDVIGCQDTDTEQTADLQTDLKQTVVSDKESDLVTVSKKDVHELKETVIVENPLRAGTHQLEVARVSSADHGCEKIPETKSIVNTRQLENTELPSVKKLEDYVGSKDSEKLKPESATDFNLQLRIKGEADEELLLEDINRKILNIKKEVKEFTTLTNMLCDIGNSNSMISLKKELTGDQDRALDLKISSACTLTPPKNYKDPKDSFADNSSFSSCSNDSAALSLKVNTAESGTASTTDNNSTASVDKDLKGAFYKCGFNGCGFASMNSTQFRTHLETAHKHVSSYPCAHCGNTSPSEESLLRHMQSHTNTKMFLLFKCAFKGCRFGTNLLHEFREHNEIFHKLEKTFSCLNCSHIFLELTELLNHLRTNLLKFIQCPHCSVKDRNRRAVLNHISEAHPGKPKQIVVTSQVVCREKQIEMVDNKTLPPQHQTQNDSQKMSIPLINDIEYIETKLKPNDIPPALRLTMENHQLSNTQGYMNAAINNINNLAVLKGQHSCKICKYTTSYPQLLQKHMDSYHPSFLGEYITKNVGKDQKKSNAKNQMLA